MASEWQLRPRREDANAPGIAALFRGKNENSFGVVELASDRLHLLVGQAACLWNYSERIPTVDVIGEYVGGVKVVRHAVKNMRKLGLRGYYATSGLVVVALNPHSRPL